MAKILSQSQLIIISASISACSFTLPYYCAEGAFIFLIPLFLLVGTARDCGFKKGFLWGLLFYVIYFIGITHLIFEKGGGEYRCVAPLILVLYGACCSGIWFWSGTFFFKKLSFLNNSTIMKIYCFAGATLLYYWWVNVGFFSLFGCFEGNQLQNPLLPLAIRISWLRWVTQWPQGLAILCVVCFQICITLFLLECKKVVLVYALFFFLPFIAGWFLSVTAQKPSILDVIGCIIPQPQHQDPWQAQEHLAELFAAYARDVSITCIILPESSFPFPLNYWQHAINCWYEHLENNEIHIIVGSHRRERENVYNSCYVLYQRRIIHCYDKTHRMFFAERLPPWWSILTTTKKLFLENKVPFTQGTKGKKPFSLLTFFCVPYMCSELFFEPVSIACSGDTDILLCLVNDSWFTNHYIPCLLYLYARYKALVIQKDVLYVSYHYASYITKEGGLYALKKVQDPIK